MKHDQVDPGATSPRLVRRANRKVRAVVMAAGIVGALAGALLLRRLPPGMPSLSRQELPSALRTLQIVVGLVFLSVVPLGAYLCWFGYRAVRWRQIPPPGTWVLRDTRVVAGPGAQRRGRIIMALGALLVVVGLFAALYFPYRLGHVLGGGDKPADPNLARSPTSPADRLGPKNGRTGTPRRASWSHELVG